MVTRSATACSLVLKSLFKNKVMKQVKKILFKMNSTIMLPLLALAISILTSCENHDEAFDSSLRIGNIYLSDDRVVSPEGYDPETDDAVGVIFAVHGDTALVVARQEMGSYIYSDSLGTIGNVINDAVTMCGQENTAAILASDFARHFPALETLDGYSSKITGWVLPSAGDLRALSASLDLVKRSMTLIGGDGFSREQYFSTSQDGSSGATRQEYYYTVSLNSGYVTSTYKKSKSRVRLILNIR